MFGELIRNARRISRDEFARDFGGVADDVVEMLDSEQARALIREAREKMEGDPPLPNGQPRLRKVEFSLFSEAPELEQGRVAAVDGTYPLPMQMYSAGQALCVGVGSVTHRRPLLDSLHYWSSRVFLSEAADGRDFLAREEEGLFGISQTAFLRYWEVKHGIEIPERYLFFDGTLVYEWLVAVQEGLRLYDELFTSGKKAVGVMKQIKASPVMAKFGRALRSGEIYVVETLEDHLLKSNASNANLGEGGERYVDPVFMKQVAPHIFRGIFKPRHKAFGFEVHEEHMEDMLRILAADAQLNYAGHEIPFLLNRVDEEIRARMSPRILRDRIAVRMASASEGLFFDEQHERDFR
jgi:hypothetical protein